MNDAQPGARTRLLLLHYQRPHFEVLLALLANLRDHYEVTVWSDSLPHFRRREFLAPMGVKLFEASQTFDAIVIVSGEIVLDPAKLGVDLSNLIQTTPTLKVMHRLAGQEQIDEMRLFPKAKFPFIPALTGFEPAPSVDESTRTILTQGNIENRRNYDLLPRLAAHRQGLNFRIVGINAGLSLAKSSNLQTHFNLSEYDFHSACGTSTFMLPLLDPVGYKQYFQNCFTSSVHIGFAYAMPFIAHRALFDLYPIVGFAYSNIDELQDCLRRAEECDEAQLAELRQKMLSNRRFLVETNLKHFAAHLHRIGVVTK